MWKLVMPLIVGLSLALIAPEPAEAAAKRGSYSKLYKKPRKSRTVKPRRAKKTPYGVNAKKSRVKHRRPKR